MSSSVFSTLMRMMGTRSLLKHSRILKMHNSGILSISLCLDPLSLPQTAVLILPNRALLPQSLPHRGARTRGILSSPTLPFLHVREHRRRKSGRRLWMLLLKLRVKLQNKETKHRANNS